MDYSADTILHPCPILPSIQTVGGHGGSHFPLCPLSFCPLLSALLVKVITHKETAAGGHHYVVSA